ncbi:hypothetical protein [Cellulomonas endophytica]|uniref:hypothetical protein n=1 Tax=Cellulomonas endophytica TaxID=2494735 RepID=UPI001013BA52|nr:hypothetical protein [Cellulomonas endophytica]
MHGSVRAGAGRAGAALVLATAVLVGTAGPPAVAARPPGPPAHPGPVSSSLPLDGVVLPLGCPFPVLLEQEGGSVVARTGGGGALLGGHGPTTTLTRLDRPDRQLVLPGGGSMIRTALHPDGTATVTSTGTTLLVLFDTDVPAGPSTTLHVGRTVLEVDAGGTFTLVSSSGPTRDLCAELAG